MRIANSSPSNATPYKTSFGYQNVFLKDNYGYSSTEGFIHIGICKPLSMIVYSETDTSTSSENIRIKSLETGFTVKVDFNLVNIDEGNNFIDAIRLIGISIFNTPDIYDSRVRYYSSLEIYANDINLDTYSLTLAEKYEENIGLLSTGVTNIRGSFTNLNKNTVNSIIFILNPVTNTLSIYQNYILRITATLDRDVLTNSYLYAIGTNMDNTIEMPALSEHPHKTNLMAKRIYRLSVWDKPLNTMELKSLQMNDTY